MIRNVKSSTDRRSRKRQVTRESISTAATKLFIKKGFDAVTIDEIAAVADVGRMTVFNHFPRKEDLFFDREEEVREIVRAALRQHPPGIAPGETLRRLAHHLVDTKSPLVEFSTRSRGFVKTIGGSASLKARAREIRDDLAGILAEALSTAVGRDAGDADARLAATLLLATWTAAFIEAHRTFDETKDAAKSNTAFLAVIDKGSRGLAAAMAGTPYG